MLEKKFSAFEFCAIVATAFGVPILTSVLALAYGKTVPDDGTVVMFTSNQLYRLVLFELIVGPVAAAMLYSRGWRVADFPLGIAASATGLGALIAGVSILLDEVIGFALRILFPDIASALDFSNFTALQVPSVPSIVLLSIVNPVFEEVFVVGYVIPALSKRFGITTAVNVSVVIRVSYHLYQGIAAFPFHLAYGLIQAYVFVRYARLWPLIVSHAILDFYALMMMR